MSARPTAVRPRRASRLAGALAVGTLAAAVLAGCGSDDDATTPTTVVPATELSGASLCDDPSGDAAAGVDLRSVGLRVRGDDLVVTWAVGRAAGLGPATFAVRLDDVEVRVDEGDDGTAEAYLVLGGDRRYDLGEADVARDQVGVRVPLDQLGALAGGWTATVAVDGEVSDTCGPAPLPGA